MTTHPAAPPPTAEQVVFDAAWAEYERQQERGTEPGTAYGLIWLAVRCASAALAPAPAERADPVAQVYKEASLRLGVIEECIHALPPSEPSSGYRDDRRDGFNEGIEASVQALSAMLAPFTAERAAPDPLAVAEQQMGHAFYVDVCRMEGIIKAAHEAIDRAGVPRDDHSTEADLSLTERIDLLQAYRLDEAEDAEDAAERAAAVPDDERTIFEAWAEPRGFVILRDAATGGYIGDATNVAWTVWRARAVRPASTRAGALDAAGADAADAARYRYLRDHHASHYPMTHEQPAEWSICWSFQQMTPEERYGTFDYLIDQDIERQKALDAEDDDRAALAAGDGASE